MVHQLRLRARIAQSSNCLEAVARLTSEAEDLFTWLCFEYEPNQDGWVTVSDTTEVRGIPELLENGLIEQEILEIKTPGPNKTIRLFIPFFSHIRNFLGGLNG